VQRSRLISAIVTPAAEKAPPEPNLAVPYRECGSGRASGLFVLGRSMSLAAGADLPRAAEILANPHIDGRVLRCYKVTQASPARSPV
jgi:hypothetical protein